MATSAEVVAYLAALPNCTKVRPIELTLNGKTYQGASYCDAKNPDVREHLYLAGINPKHAIKRKSVCFRRQGDHRDWYIACYYPEQKKTATVNEYHPFGATFMLLPWEIPNQPENKIDTHETHTYQRIPMEVKYLDE